MLRKKIDKRGSVQDVILLGLYALVFAIILLICFKVGSSINSNLQSSSLISTEGKTASARVVNFYPGIIDNTFLLFTVGVGLVTLMLAAFVRVHPVFIPIFFLALVFTIFLSGVFSNVYQEIAGSADFVAEANQLKFATTILTYLPMFVGVFGFVLMVVMYRNWQASQ